MSDKKNKISKQKGVDLCIDLLSRGETTKEILRFFTVFYGVCRSTVEKWLKVARPIAELRQEEANKIMARENEAAIIESAKKLNLSRERILEEYSKIAFFDIRKLYNEEGAMKPIHEIDDQSAAAITGLESLDEKVPGTQTIIGTLKKLKLSDKRAALDSICRVMGYNSPEKVAPTNTKGEDLKDVRSMSNDKLIEYLETSRNS